MKYLNQIYANRKPPKYALGGFPVVGSINPKTGQPYTIEEINSYNEFSDMLDPFTINDYGNKQYGGLDKRENQIYGYYDKKLGNEKLEDKRFNFPKKLDLGITTPIITDSSTVNSLDGLKSSVELDPSKVITTNSLTGLSDKSLGKVRPNYFNRMSDAQVKGINAGISAGANLVTPLIDEASKSSVVDDLGVTHTKESVAGGAASGAAKGLAISASLGFADFGASAVIGGLVGGLQSKLGNDKVDSQMRDATNSVYNKKVDFAKTRYKTLKSQGFNEAGKQTTMFAEGGEITRKPIVVNNPNDPKLKAYKDSIDIYNMYLTNIKAAKNNNLVKKRESNKNMTSLYIGSSSDVNQQYDVRNFNHRLAHKADNEKLTPQKRGFVEQKNNTSTPNNPIGGEFWESKSQSTDLTNTTSNKTGNGREVRKSENLNLSVYIPKVAKPVQPYVYKKPEPKKDYWDTDKDVLAFRKTFKEKFGEEPSRDPKIAKYDYDKAYKSGVRPVLDSTDGLYHWSSKFKHDDHPNLIVNGVNTKTGKPVEQPKKIEEPVKPTYTSQKQLFQGYDFTLQTGLKPGLYHPEEIEEIKKQKKEQPVNKIIPTKFSKGGNLVPQYEVEGNEIIQGTDTQLEGQEDLASDMTKAVGPSHANGGVKGNGGERVFSDRLYASPMLTSTLKALKIKLSNNPTYAEAAEAIAKKKGKFEKNIKSPDPISNKTANTMVERMDSLIEGVFQEQEILKQVENNNTVMAFGGKIPKYFKGADLVEQFTPEQAANTVAYLSNLKSANKQKTGFKRNVGEPVLLEKMDYLPIAKNSIYGAARTGYLSNKRSSGNVQDRFSRDAAITTSTMEALNQAIQSQAERDLNINNANAQILGNYNARKAEAENADMIDKIQGENDILVNKRAATNAWLQGIMGNVASKRAYDVEKAKIAIARMDGGRGTAERSDEDLALMVQSKTITPSTYKMLTGKNYQEPKHSKGGYIKKSKKYC